MYLTFFLLTIYAGCLEAIQGCPRLVVPMLYYRSTYMEGHDAVDLFLDSRGSLSRTCLLSIRD